MSPVMFINRCAMPDIAINVVKTLKPIPASLLGCPHNRNPCALQVHIWRDGSG